MRSKLSATSDSARERMLAQRAYEMRRAPTPSEARLFEALRGGRLGVAFRRQVPLLGRYIVDLLAPQARLVVEIDGGAHVGRERADARRDRALERAGFRVLRVEAREVLGDLDAAVERVRAAIVAARMVVIDARIQRCA